MQLGERRRITGSESGPGTSGRVTECSVTLSEVKLTIASYEPSKLVARSGN